MGLTFTGLGFGHVTDLNGYDHIVYLIALVAAYSYKEWKSIFILITAFTIGHSITLVLSGLQIFILDQRISEILVPCTIVLTALSTIFFNKKQSHLSRYAIALFFGLIHGVAFSNYFKVILGQSDQIVKPLLFFNIGVELGQLLIVACILLVNYIFIKINGDNQKKWTIGLSVISIVFSLILFNNLLTSE